jgi:3-deoxy-D-manno-octulosonic-acid transferase
VRLPAALTASPRPFTCIAGSTWAADEACVVSAWRKLCAGWDAGVPPRLLLVPHEPSPGRLAEVEVRLHTAGLVGRRYAALAPGDAAPGAAPAGAAPEPAPGEVIVVDRVGVLAELYATADAAYVGGAFTTGVHNVMEPASVGLPVFFGPKHHNAPEAEMLLETGAAGVVRSPAELERAWGGLAADPEARARMGERARTLIEAHLGASERCLQRLLAALGAPAPESP